MKKKYFPSIGIIIFFIYIFLAIPLYIFQLDSPEKAVESLYMYDVKMSEVSLLSKNDFYKMVDANEIKKVYIDNYDIGNLYYEGDFYCSTNDMLNPKYFKVIFTDDSKMPTNELQNFINANHDIEFKNAKSIEFFEDKVKTYRFSITIIFVISIIFSIMFVEASKDNRRREYDNFERHIEKLSNIPYAKNNTMVLGYSKEEENIEEDSQPKKYFSDVAGLREVKKDVKCLVDFIKNKEKYTAAGAKLPKGVILYGPPGTGKTLLAKAIAGEADIPFIYESGSNFVEMYVGVGSKRVRELFEKARQKAPCIIFIDEIDAIGSKRTGYDNGEDRKTLDALLTEMDGFKESENILVIAATNRIEDLDSALLRPGRFTEKYCVPLPETLSERMEVINLYIKNKKLSDEIDLDSLAKETIGYSPAKIEALLNSAAIISVQDGEGIIRKSDIDKAMTKILLNGHMKEDSSERSMDEIKTVAFHEAGHAIVGHIFGKDITKVTVVASTSGAGGVTFSIPKEGGLSSAKDLKNQIMELYAGRLAELIYFKGDKELITTGASNDIERASKLIDSYVKKYGMSDKFGLLNLKDEDNEKIFETKIKLSKELEEKTYEILNKNKDVLFEIAQKLIDDETIYKDELNNVFEKFSI